jgi:Bacterial Ig-like domain
MSWMGGWFDPELEDLFQDEPELLETAKQVRASRPRVEADPRFQNRLRAQLVAEASRGRSARGARRWWRVGPAGFAWSGAVVGAALITATVLTFVSNSPKDQTVTAFSQLTAQHSVSPNQVITVSFNQPMNETVVENHVHIQPAVKYTVSWKNNDLVITPVYHLSANTPYTVTIKKTYLVAASGASAAAPINITFATKPTPTPQPASPPSLAPVVLGANGTGGSLLYAPDGSAVVSTEGVIPASATTAPSPTATPTPAANATPTPEGAIAGAPPVPGALVEFPTSGTAAQIGPSASAAAYSPNDRYLAMAVDDGNGGSRIITSQSDGSAPDRLADSTTQVTALTWASNDRIIYTDGTTVYSVDLSHTTNSLYTLPTGSGVITALATGGAYAYVSPATGTGGSLLNISSGAEQTLQGATTDVAFSGNGATVAWVDDSVQPGRLLTEPVTQNTPAALSMPDSNANPSDVALDMRADEITYVSTNASSGVGQLVVAQLPSGTPLAVTSISNISELTLSPGGDHVAFVSNTPAGASIEQAPVPGAPKSRAGLRIPDAANATLQSFVQAQVGQNGQPDLGTLAALSAAGVNAASDTPPNLSRAYVISTSLGPTGVVEASIELIVDPDAGHTTTRVASEQVLIAQSSGSYLVTSATIFPLRNESAGPHVVQVTPSTAGGVTTLVVTFDSDLTQATVSGAITVENQAGVILNSTAVYDPDTRTATVTLANAPSGTLTLEIATSLADVEGQSLANGFQTTFETGS